MEGRLHHGELRGIVDSCPQDPLVRIVATNPELVVPSASTHDFWWNRWLMSSASGSATAAYDHHHHEVIDADQFVVVYRAGQSVVGGPRRWLRTDGSLVAMLWDATMRCHPESALSNRHCALPWFMMQAIVAMPRGVAWIARTLGVLSTGVQPFSSVISTSPRSRLLGTRPVARWCPDAPHTPHTGHTPFGDAPRPLQNRCGGGATTPCSNRTFHLCYW